MSLYDFSATTHKSTWWVQLWCNWPIRSHLHQIIFFHFTSAAESSSKNLPVPKTSHHQKQLSAPQLFKPSPPRFPTTSSSFNSSSRERLPPNLFTFSHNKRSESNQRNNNSSSSSRSSKGRRSDSITDVELFL